jgi:hypothetical protein
LKCFFAQKRFFDVVHKRHQNQDSCVVYSQAIGIRFSS